MGILGLVSQIHKGLQPNPLEINQKNGMTYSLVVLSMHGHAETRNPVVRDVPAIRQLVRQKNEANCKGYDTLGAL